MNPSELRELAKWHDDEAYGHNAIGHYEDGTVRNVFHCHKANRHSKAARALNFLADVLEQRPVAYVTDWQDIRELAMSELEGGEKLIIKPTFNSSNGSFECPIDYPGCKQNCGNYGCGN